MYIGVMSNLIKRIYEHKHGLADGFSKRYKLHTLVWYERHESMEYAIQREKAMKKWNRSWKIKLIETTNTDWKDLYTEII